MSAPNIPLAPIPYYQVADDPPPGPVAETLPVISGSCVPPDYDSGTGPCLLLIELSRDAGRLCFSLPSGLRGDLLHLAHHRELLVEALLGQLEAALAQEAA